MSEYANMATKSLQKGSSPSDGRIVKDHKTNRFQGTDNRDHPIQIKFDKRFYGTDSKPDLWLTNYVMTRS
jgi:hypothetical protein